MLDGVSPEGVWLHVVDETDREDFPLKVTPLYTANDAVASGDGAEVIELQEEVLVVPNRLLPNRIPSPCMVSRQILGTVRCQLKTPRKAFNSDFSTCFVDPLSICANQLACSVGKWLYDSANRCPHTRGHRPGVDTGSRGDVHMVYGDNRLKTSDEIHNTIQISASGTIPSLAVEPPKGDAGRA